MRSATVLLPLQQPPEIGLAGINLMGRRDDRLYRIPDRWSLHLVNWTGSYEIADVRFAVKPGTAVLIPADASHRSIMPDRAESLYVQFTPRGAASTSVLRQCVDLGHDFAATWLALHDLVDWHERLPVRASARLWEVLWTLAVGSAQRIHPIVEQACVLVRWHLHEPLSVAWLAQRCAVSHNRLTRLFRSELRCTVTGYIQERRLEQARYLLTQRSMPVAQVAAAVGISDGRYLARLMKHRHGVSPSALRQGDPVNSGAGKATEASMQTSVRKRVDPQRVSDGDRSR